MSTDVKLLQGTKTWFEMVGELLCDAARTAGLSPTLTLSLVERYTDGLEISGGLVQGIRFDIINGNPSFRVGAGRDERGDITIEITSAAARKLNTMYGAEFQKLRGAYLRRGEMRVDGDPSKFGEWLDTAHDAIVGNTI